MYAHDAHDAVYTTVIETPQWFKFGDLQRFCGGKRGFVRSYIVDVRRVAKGGRRSYVTVRTVTGGAEAWARFLGGRQVPITYHKP